MPYTIVAKDTTQVRGRGAAAQHGVTRTKVSAKWEESVEVNPSQSRVFLEAEHVLYKEESSSVKDGGGLALPYLGEGGELS